MDSQPKIKDLAINDDQTFSQHCTRLKWFKNIPGYNGVSCMNLQIFGHGFRKISLIKGFMKN